MEIKTESLTLYPVNKESELHRKFIEELGASDLADLRLAPFDELVKTPQEPSHLFWQNFYIVGEKGLFKNHLIGIVHPFKLLFRPSDELEINAYAVHPKYRNLGKGTKILRETSDFIFANHQCIDIIKLYISEENIISQKAALKAGFIPSDDYGIFGNHIRKR